MKSLLGVSFIEFLNQPLIIVGLILLAFGIAMAILAKRITRVARQSDDVDPNDRIYSAFKIIGLLLIIAGFICISVDIILYIVNR